MKGFELYVYNSEYYRILLTKHDNFEPTKNPTLFSTFDEKFSEAEHDQFTLTFSMMKWVDSVQNNKIAHIENQFHKLLQIGTKLELIIDSREHYIFVIKQIKPTIGKNNIKYDYTCQDEVSYTWSRRNVGLSYSTMEEGGVQTIYEIAKGVLNKAHIFEWDVWINEDAEVGGDHYLSNTKITLDVVDSNPYNIIIEACNALNCKLKVDYVYKRIWFIQQDDIEFSGYRYRPNYNLKSFDVDYSGEEFATIMHVYGGTDEYDRIVSMVPALPDRVKDWWMSFGKNTDNAFKTSENGVQSLDWGEFKKWLPTTTYELTAYKLNETYQGFSFNREFCDKYFNVKEIYDKMNNTSTQWLTFEKGSDRYKITKKILSEQQSGSMTLYKFGLICLKNDSEETIFFTIEHQGPEAYELIWQNTSISFDDTYKLTTAFYDVMSYIQYNKTFIDENGDITNENTITYTCARYMDTTVTEEENIFISIAEKVPCLGQFLYDFNFFKLNKQLKEKDYITLMNKLQYNMAKNNMNLRIIEPTYYKIYSYTQLYLAEVRAALDNLQAARKLNVQGTTDGSVQAEISKRDNEYKSKLTQLKSMVTKITSSKDYTTGEIWKKDKPNPLYNPAQVTFTLDLLQTLVDEYKYYLNNLETAKEKMNMTITGDDFEIIEKEAEKQYYTQQYWTLVTIIGEPKEDDDDNTIYYDGEYQNILVYDENGQNKTTLNNPYSATYPQLITDIVKMLCGGNTSTQDDNTSESLTSQLAQLQQDNENLWSEFYKAYAPYIYEAKYENSDEIASISLFNQATRYYEDYNRPKGTYSMAILDVSMLEKIGIPRLTVGSKIKVYVPELNLNESVYDENGEIQEHYTDIQYKTNNDLIVSSINYDLRKPLETTVSVEQITPYSIILQKLIKSVQ